jgi:hypothetical protein
MSYRVFDKKRNEFITDEQEWVMKPDGSLYYRTVGYGELVPWSDAMVINDGCIYLITVFDKCEPNERWGYELGCRRSVGFRWTLEDAIDTVESNMCDIWEYSYDYACIEELNGALYPWADERWFFKFNTETKRYEQIDEPVILKNRGPIGGIG